MRLVIVIGIPVWAAVDAHDRLILTVAIDKMSRVDVVVPDRAITTAWDSKAAFVKSWKRLCNSLGPWAWAVELDRQMDTCTFRGWMDLGGDTHLGQLAVDPDAQPVLDEKAREWTRRV